MKLFIEYILDEIEQIGLKNDYRVSLSSTKNEENYLRGVMQYFDVFFDIHFVIIFSFPEKNPDLNYTFWILDRFGNKKLVGRDKPPKNEAEEEDTKESDGKEDESTGSDAKASDNDEEGSKGSKDEESNDTKDMIAKIQDVALKEIHVNLAEGADIRYLLQAIEDIVKE